MAKIIDNTDMLVDAHRIVGFAQDLLDRLDSVEKDTPAKEETYRLIKLIIEAQSDAIRQLVEQHVQICDQLNLVIAKHPDL